MGKQENLVGDLVIILRKCGIGFSESELRKSDPVNVSKGKNIRTERSLIRKFHMLEYPTMVRFGYKTPNFIRSIEGLK